MKKLLVSERMSLDGVFDADTMGEWSFPYATDEVITTIRDGILRCDVYLLGRTTYEMLAPGWAKMRDDQHGLGNPLISMQKVVVSSTLKQADWDSLKEANWHPSTVIRDHVAEAITQLKTQPGKDILVHGSATLVQTLIQAGLVDEFEFIVFPAIVGTGKRFFTEDMRVIGLELVETKAVGDRGVVVNKYRPNKSSQS
jgi:dihydrofolate reductase